MSPQSRKNRSPALLSTAGMLDIDVRGSRLALAFGMEWDECTASVCTPPVRVVGMV